MTTAVKISIYCSLATASAFSATSLLFYFGDWVRLGFTCGLGLFVGLVAAPEIAPSAFKHPSALQLISGLIAGLLTASLFSSSPETMALGAIIGTVVGWSTPIWVKHLQIP